MCGGSVSTGLKCGCSFGLLVFSSGLPWISYA